MAFITKKSHEIPDEQWGQAPDLSSWQSAATDARLQQMKEMAKRLDVAAAQRNTYAIAQKTFACRDQYSANKFQNIKGMTILDIGASGHLLEVALGNTVSDPKPLLQLRIVMADPSAVFIPVFRNREIDYHEVGINQYLGDMNCVVADGISPTLIIRSQNKVYEYQVHETLHALSTYEFNIWFNWTEETLP